MAKYRKTKQQKVISDLRKKLQTLDQDSSSSVPLSNTPKEKFSYKFVGSTSNLNTTKTISIKDSSFPFLLHDLSRTAVLTGTIILAQLILLFLLKNHIVMLPMVRY